MSLGVAFASAKENVSKSSLKSKKELRTKENKVGGPIGPRYPWALDFCGEIVYCLAFDAQEAQALAEWYDARYITACDYVERYV